jgi:hypothetical protein
MLNQASIATYADVRVGSPVPVQRSGPLIRSTVLIFHTSSTTFGDLDDER